MSYLPCIADDEGVEWLCQRIGMKRNPGLWVICAIDAKADIHGAIGIESETHTMVSMHMALDNPLALRTIIRPACQIAFGKDRKYVSAMVRATNDRALKLDRHLGMKEVYRIPDGWAEGEDLVCLLGKREDCRFID